MKLVIYVFLLLISAQECDKNKTQLTPSSSSEITAEFSEIKQQDRTKLIYHAITRGHFLKIWIQGDSISFTNDRDLKLVTSHQLPREEKEALLKLLSAVDETLLPELEVPSKAHQYDAAQMAWLEIEHGVSIYKTEVFDHGKPPKEIKDLVEKILSLKTMVEKQ